MAATSMIGFSQLFILLGFGGFLGLPLGLPPGPEDPAMSRVAPAECLFYTSWTGMAQPDAKSKNQTEQLLAEPEVRQFASEVEKHVRKTLTQAIQRQNPEMVAPLEFALDFAHTVITRPTAVYLGKLEVKNPQTPPKLNAGFMVNLGQGAGKFRETLEKHQERILGGKVESVKIGDTTWYQAKPAPEAPLFTWGTQGEHFILGIGDDEVPSILKRLEGQPPKWLTDLRQRLAVPRISTVAYVNIKTILDLVSRHGGPKAETVIRRLGVENVTWLGAVSGLDETGFITRSLLAMNGEPEGLLAAFLGKPLTPADLASIPRDPMIAVAMRLDADRLWSAYFDFVEKIEPNAAQQMSQGVVMLEQQLGINLRNDVLKPLGNTWSVYTRSVDGSLIPTGLTFVARLNDPKKFAETHEKLLNQAKAALENAPEGRAPKISQFEFQGRTVYQFEPPGRGFPLAPSWSVTDKELVVGLFPQNLKTYLSRGADFQSLATVPEVAQAFEGGKQPILISYQDSAEIFRTVYPLVQMGIGMALSNMGERSGGAAVSILPMADSIRKHLRPGISIVMRTDSGIESVARQTLPGGNIGASAPVAVALLLPAVQSAREAARRSQSTNNLKQIGIAIHNYADVNKTFPPAFTADDNGKPLLSWRVHILPYIEQENLYRQFHLDEPWDSEHNKKLIEQMPATYRAPNSAAGPGKTVYLGVGGKQGCFPGSKPVGFADITDGTSNTIMTVEASDPRAVIWTKPDDFEPDPKDPLKGLVGLRPGGFIAGLADGSVRFISATVDKAVLRNLFDRADGNPVGNY